MCGCEQGTCPGGCPCGCSHTPPSPPARVKRSGSIVTVEEAIPADGDRWAHRECMESGE